MPQIFHRSTNTISKVSIIAGGLGAGLLIAFAYGMDRGAYITDVAIAKDQPVPFSHQHHVSDDGFDCRYCHTSVETSAVAGLPATEICMTCHSQIWSNALLLEPVRASFRTGESLQWTRIHDLPDYVYFNHSIHISKGVGCASCHGRIDLMPLTFKVNTLYMNWCIECHRNPEKQLRPRDQVYNMAYEQPPNQEEFGRQLMKEYRVQSLTDCYTCHR